MVERHVVAQDQRTTRADAQALAHLDAARLKLGDFFQQMRHVDHHAIADEARNALADDARRHQIELVLGGSDHQRVTRVVTTLKPDHTLGMIGQPVDDLALALVAPLGTDHYDVLRHDCSCMVSATTCHA